MQGSGLTQKETDTLGTSLITHTTYTVCVCSLLIQISKHMRHSKSEPKLPKHEVRWYQAVEKKQDILNLAVTG